MRVARQSPLSLISGYMRIGYKSRIKDPPLPPWVKHRRAERRSAGATARRGPGKRPRGAAGAGRGGAETEAVSVRFA